MNRDPQKIKMFEELYQKRENKTLNQTIQISLDQMSGTLDEIQNSFWDWIGIRNNMEFEDQQQSFRYYVFTFDIQDELNKRKLTDPL